MGIETTRWDVADRLTDDESVLAYMEAVFEDGDPALIAAALNDVARAKGLADVDWSSDVPLDSVIGLMRALGLELTAKAA